jgi:hypothetical protein
MRADWRNLHIERLHSLQSSPNIIKSRLMRLVGHAPIMRGMRNIHKKPRRKSERKSPRGRPRLIRIVKDSDVCAWI